MQNQHKAIATATFNGCYHKDAPAYLLPSRTKRAGVAMTVYRWIAANGACVDGLSHGFGAERMMRHASRYPGFSNVVPL